MSWHLRNSCFFYSTIIGRCGEKLSLNLAVNSLPSLCFLNSAAWAGGAADTNVSVVRLQWWSVPYYTGPSVKAHASQLCLATATDST